MSNYRIIEKSNKVGKTTYWLQKKTIISNRLFKTHEECWDNVKIHTGVLWFKESINFDSIEKMNDWIEHNIVIEPKEDKIIREF